MLVATPADSAICRLRERVETQFRSLGIAAATGTIAPPAVAHAVLCVAKYEIAAVEAVPTSVKRNHNADWPGSVEWTAFCGFRNGIATSVVTWSVA
jgi:hypothetical protein